MNLWGQYLSFCPCASAEQRMNGDPYSPLSDGRIGYGSNSKVNDDVPLGYNSYNFGHSSGNYRNFDTR